MEKFSFILFAYQTLITAGFTASININNQNDESPVLIVSGSNLQKNLTVQIFTSIFLLIAYFDFIFQTVLLFYVFFQLARKLETKSEFGFAFFGIAVFTALRSTFVMFFILPIPWDWAPSLPNTLVDTFIYLNMTLFVIFYGFSMCTCLYYMIFVGTSGKKMSGSLIDPKTGREPKVIILMPIYNEEPDALFRAVESAIRCNYRSDRLHVFLAFDEVSETALYFSLLKKLHVLSKEVSTEIKAKLTLILENEGNSSAYEIFPPRLEWYIEGVRVTVCRFPHSGKSPTQAKSFKIINEMYGQDENPDNIANTLVLFIDSDIILHDSAIHNFVVNAVAHPNVNAMTGLVTCRTSRKFNMFQYLQDAEYIDGQMFSRTAEATLGAVTCLPGALSLIRLNALQNVAPKYFIEIDKKRTVDFHRFHLGEDRYMTYLLTEDAQGPYQIRFLSNATCKTDAPDTFQKLLKQRRRWFLGGFVNDVSSMISPVMWKKVPLVVLINIYFYSSKGLSWIFPILLISLSVNENPGFAMYFVIITFGLRFLLLAINSFLMTRNKVCLSYLFLYFLAPIFIWIVTLYAVWTWNVKSWGGPRTDQDVEQVSKLKVLEDVMASKEEASGKTRKSLGQIKTVSRVIDNNLRNQNGAFNSVRSTHSIRSNVSGKSGDAPPLKKFVPFPYEAEFLCGGDYTMSEDSVVIPPTTPKMSNVSSSPTCSIRSSVTTSPNLLSPIILRPVSSGGLHHSNSMPELNTLTANAPYLFAKLSPETQKRASSFRLDTDFLAKVGNLATTENSKQRKSSFNMRLSGRSSPTCESSQPSFVYYGDGDSVGNDVVDIVIHVPPAKN